MAPDDAGSALKLRAEDADDLAVLSACLQDALVPVRDLAYVPDQKIFVFVANRFRWESGLRPAPGDGDRQRILCAVTFSAVAGVSSISDIVHLLLLQCSVLKGRVSVESAGDGP